MSERAGRAVRGPRQATTPKPHLRNNDQNCIILQCFGVITFEASVLHFSWNCDWRAEISLPAHFGATQRATNTTPNSFIANIVNWTLAFILYCVYVAPDEQKSNIHSPCSSVHQLDANFVRGQETNIIFIDICLILEIMLMRATRVNQNNEVETKTKSWTVLKGLLLSPSWFFRDRSDVV